MTLEEYLGNIGRYLSDAGGVTPNLNLLAERDTHVLVSAQAAFLPVPQQGIAEFNPVILNYQSYAANPAVLTIVVTAEGTSATIIGPRSHRTHRLVDSLLQPPLRVVSDRRVNADRGTDRPVDRSVPQLS